MPQKPAGTHRVWAYIVLVKVAKGIAIEILICLCMQRCNPEAAATCQYLVHALDMSTCCSLTSTKTGPMLRHDAARQPTMKSRTQMPCGSHFVLHTVDFTPCSPLTSTNTGPMLRRDATRQPTMKSRTQMPCGSHFGLHTVDFTPCSPLTSTNTGPMLRRDATRQPPMKSSTQMARCGRSRITHSMAQGAQPLHAK